MVLNNLDYAILLLGLYIIYQSAKKGFIEEFIGGLSLILAFSVTYVFGSAIEKKIYDLVEIKFLSMTISYALIFIIMLSIFYYIISLIIPKMIIKTSIDRILGVVFGFIKFGFVILFLGYIVDLVFPKEIQPDLVKESYFKHYSKNILGYFLE